MTEHNAAAVPELVPESFWSILLRRGRYVAAIAVAALLFSWLGWTIVSPPAEMDGVSLMGWWSVGSALAMASTLLVLLAVVAMICTFMVHPDAPHIGMFCAMAGMASLAIRGGGSRMLIQYAQFTNGYAALCKTLAGEAVVWGVLIAVGEWVARLAHDRFFSNTHWVTRSGAALPEASVKPFSTNRGDHRGVSLAVSQAIGTKDLPTGISVPLAMAYSTAVALLLLYVTLQSESKGQVLFACFVAFFLATGNAYLAFPRVPAVAFFLAVPVTAVVGYLWASGYTAAGYPGHGGLFITRALPIDFVTAGVPGAILGYYAAVRWALHSDDTV